MFCHTIAMHKPMFGPNGEHVCPRNCLNFPVQKCSSACGIIAFTFVAISAFTPTNVWECICSPHMALNDVKSNLTLFWQASKYSPYLSKVLACWISTQTIDVTNIIDKSALVPMASSFSKHISYQHQASKLRHSLKQKDCKTEKDSFGHKNAPCDEGTENSNEISLSTTHLDISSVTVPQLTTGQEFSSFEELKHCISSYERATFVQLYIRRSGSLESAKKRATKTNFSSDLRFSELQYNCIHGGIISSHGVQENALITRKSYLFVEIAIQHLYMHNFTTLQNLSNGMLMFCENCSINRWTEIDHQRYKPAA